MGVAWGGSFVSWSRAVDGDANEQKCREGRWGGGGGGVCKEYAEGERKAEEKGGRGTRGRAGQEAICEHLRKAGEIGYGRFLKIFSGVVSVEPFLLFSLKLYPHY